MQKCPHCHTTIIIKSDGTCPSCHTLVKTSECTFSRPLDVMGNVNDNNKSANYSVENNDLNAKQNKTQASSKHFTFRTPMKHIMGEVLLFFMIAPLFAIVALLLSGLFKYLMILVIPDGLLDESIIIFVTIIIPVFSFFCFFTWLWAIHRWKFTLQIESKEIHFGRRPFRESISCLDVEAIRETAEQNNDPSSYWVEITAPGIKWKCFFGALCEDCIAALRSICTNAVFVDARGKEHLPSNTHSPVRAIKNLVRSRFRRAYTALFVSIPFFAWGVIIFIAIIDQKKKGVPLSEIINKHWRLLLISLIGVISLITAITLFRKALSLSKWTKKHIKNGLDEINSEMPIDLFDSDIENN